MPGAFLRDDLPSMLRTTEFASVARVRSGPHAGEDILGILDEPITEAFSVGASTPTFTAPDDVVLEQGDQIEIDGSPFRLKLPEPDNTGLIRYPLTRL
jgi:hypothetical protein